MFQATDPAGASIRSAESDGDIFDAQGTESSPAELDPMGGNVATESPFVTQTGGTSCVGCGLLDEDDVLFVDGQRQGFTLNGFSIHVEEAFRMMAAGSAHMIHNDRSAYVMSRFGLGRWIDIDGESGTRVENGEIIHFVVNIAIFEPFFFGYGGQASLSRISEKDVKQIANDLQAIFDANPKCESFIQDILKTAQTDRNPVVSLNLLDAFWAAFQQGGIYWIEGGDAGGEQMGNVAERNSRIELLKRKPSIPGASEATNREFVRSQQLITAQSAIAETIHNSGAFGYNDIEMSFAVAERLGITPPNYGEQGPRKGQTRRAWIQSWSNWWHPKVAARCSINAVIETEASRNRPKRR